MGMRLPEKRFLARVGLTGGPVLRTQRATTSDHIAAGRACEPSKGQDSTVEYLFQTQPASRNYPVIVKCRSRPAPRSCHGGNGSQRQSRCAGRSFLYLAEELYGPRMFADELAVGVRGVKSGQRRARFGSPSVAPNESKIPIPTKSQVEGQAGFEAPVQSCTKQPQVVCLLNKGSGGRTDRRKPLFNANGNRNVRGRSARGGRRTRRARETDSEWGKIAGHENTSAAV